MDIQVTPKMEQRLCLQCAKPYKVTMISKVRFCSKVCQDYYAIEVKNPLKKESIEPESDITKKCNAPSLEPMSLSATESEESEMLKKSVSDQKLITIPTNHSVDLEKLNGLNKQGSESMNIGETTITKTGIDLPSRFIKEEQSEIHSTDLVEQSTNLEMEVSRSTNLLKSTANELHKLMIGLNGNQPPSDIRLYDVERVKAAAECGKQIISTMRMQLDILKFAKDIRNGQ